MYRTLLVFILFAAACGLPWQPAMGCVLQEPPSELKASGESSGSATGKTNQEEIVERIASPSDYNDRYLLLAFLLPSLGACAASAMFAYLVFQRRGQSKISPKREVDAVVEGGDDSVTLPLSSQTLVNSRSQDCVKKQLEESIGHLTGNVAHDFNNLLQVIQTANEVVLKSQDLKQNEREMLMISSKSVQAGAEIIRQLLAYAQQQNLSPSRLKVDVFLREELAKMASEISEGCEVEYKVEAKDFYVNADRDYLLNALKNLFRNSSDAMDSSGVVHVELDGVTLPDADTRWELPAGHYVRFRISDTGKGMSPHERSVAFDPFYTTKSHGSGTGLGLSLVYGFSRQSGGDVRLLPNGAIGTCVEMLLPQVEAPELLDLGEPVGEVDCEILIVEDKLEVGKSLLERVRALGFEAELVFSGDEAVALLESAEDRFDLVLSDIHMPGDYDGIQLKYWVNQHKPRLPIILMTGYNGYDSAALGVTILQKPFSEMDLLNSITNEYLRASQQVEHADSSWVI